MTHRPTYVYRLDITYPAGSDQPEWAPPGWEDDPESLAYEAETGARITADWHWPSERMYLSRAGAVHRAARLERYGASVTIRRSAAVSWPDGAEGAGQ